MATQDSTCAVPGCDKKRNARGWCPMHYQRWKLHGTPLWEPPTKPMFCAVPECALESYKRGHCNMHYIRLRKTGDPGPVGTVVNIQDSICLAPDCELKAKSRGWCGMHYARISRTGTHQAPPLRVSERNGMWKGDNASYFAIHIRLKAIRGKASQYMCTECGGQARHWAYDNADPNEKQDGGGRFSTDPNHYRPMCVSCHRKFDFNHAKKEASS